MFYIFNELLRMASEEKKLRLYMDSGEVIQIDCEEKVSSLSGNLVAASTTETRVDGGFVLPSERAVIDCSKINTITSISI